MKKLFTKISLLFAGLMLCAGNAWAEHVAIGETGLYWEYDAVNTTLTITGSGALPDYEEAAQPYYSAIHGGGEFSIQQATFNLVLPDGLTAIGAHAFDFGSMVSIGTSEITIPASVESIGDYAFDGWTMLETVNLERSFNTEYSVTSFSETTFNNCFMLLKALNGTIYVPDETTQMMYTYAGTHYDNYDFVVAGSGSAPQTGYEFTADDVEYRIEGSIMGIYMLTIIGADGYSDAELDLPEFITTIPGYEEGTYYASIFSIAEEAFKDNTYITSVTIPSNVYTIGARAFQGCSNLTSITYTGTAAITIGENAFATGNSNTRQNVSFSDANTTYTGARIAAYAGTGIKCNVTIERPIQKGNQYNTLCLPFSLSAAEIASSALAGVEVYEFANATKDGEYLDLHFRPVTSIEAGMPYFIRFAEEGANLTSLVFEDVTLVPDAQSVTHGDATLHGLLSEAALSGSNKLYLAANNELHWYDYGKTVYPFRAYFEVAGGMSLAPKARIVAHENATTGVEDVAAESKAVKFVENGQILIKRGEAVYNLQGQVVK